MVCYCFIILSSLLITSVRGYPWSSMTSLQQLQHDQSASLNQQNFKEEESFEHSLRDLDEVEDEEKWSRYDDVTGDGVTDSLINNNGDEEGKSRSEEEEEEEERASSEIDKSVQKARVKAFNSFTYNLKKFIKQAMLRRSYERSQKSHKQKKQSRFRGPSRGRPGGSKTGEYTLSIVNPLEVLRRRLELEMARRRMKENHRQIKANEAILKNLG